LTGDALQFSANNRWITTLAGRVGVAANNWLFYAGGGWVRVNNPTLADVTTGASISVSNSNSNSGWLAGGGIERAFAPSWTARVECDFLGLNNSSLTVPIGTPVIGGDLVTITNRDVQTLTVGVNYLFNLALRCWIELLHRRGLLRRALTATSPAAKGHKGSKDLPVPKAGAPGQVCTS
jgi:opacity protein-like surface antigen